MLNIGHDSCIVLIKPDKAKYMKRFVYVLLLLFAIALGACQKNYNTPIDPEKMEDLTVPASFSWETTQQITVTILSESSRVIQITSEDENTRYHKGFYNQIEDPYTVKLKLPADIQRLRINGSLYDISGESLLVDLDPVAKSQRALHSFEFPAGLVSYWSFNQVSNNIAPDASGLNNGTVSGATAVAGVSGKALHFDGTGQNVTAPTSSSLNTTSNQISFSLWFARQSLTQGGSFAYINTKYILRMDANGKISWNVYNPTWSSITIDYTNRIVDMNWHHLVATYDGETLKIYIDGILKKEGNATGNLQASSAPLIIGSQSTINFFNGYIDEVALFSRALTPEEVSDIQQNNYNPGTDETAILSHWSLDELANNQAIDQAGGYNGTVTNATLAQGMVGNCYEFNGTDATVIIPHNSIMNLSPVLSLMAWVKTRENKTVKIAQKGDWDGYGLYQDKWSGWRAGVRLEDNTNLMVGWGNGVPQLNEWYHVAMTFDGTTLSLYVNGQLTSTNTTNVAIHPNTRTFSIGSDNGAQKFFNGYIDEVKLYASALSQIEVQAVMEQTAQLTDQDGDGIQDDEDDYPADASRVFDNFYPAGENASLAFEDLWPGKGDYDFNDLVVDYQFTAITNQNNKLTEVIGTFVVRANGAGLRNGFGFQLDGNVAASDMQVEGSEIGENYINLNENGTEANQNKPTIIVFDNIKNILQSSAGFGANVVPGLPYVDPDTIQISMAFTPNTYSLADLNIESWNPFLIVDMDRGKEIHLPDDAPTSLADIAYFGQMDDDSDPAMGRYYKTSINLPWAINISRSFAYTNENALITQAYLKFAEWAESGGASYNDWYLDESGYRDDAYIYTKPE